MKSYQKYFSVGLLAMFAQAAFAQSAPGLGSAASFAVLSAASDGGGAVTCTDSIISGDVGSSGQPASVVRTRCSISGAVVAPVSDQVVSDFDAAYANLRDEVACTAGNTFTATSLGDHTFAPGVYCFTAAVTETNAVWTLKGGSNDLWIFKIGTAGAWRPHRNRFHGAHGRRAGVQRVLVGRRGSDDDDVGLPGNDPRGCCHHRDRSFEPDYPVQRRRFGESRSDVDELRRHRLRGMASLTRRRRSSIATRAWATDPRAAIRAIRTRATPSARTMSWAACRVTRGARAATRSSSLRSRRLRKDPRGSFFFFAWALGPWPTKFPRYVRGRTVDRARLADKWKSRWDLQPSWVAPRRGRQNLEVPQ